MEVRHPRSPWSPWGGEGEHGTAGGPVTDGGARARAVRGAPGGARPTVPSELRRPPDVVSRVEKRCEQTSVTI